MPFAEYLRVSGPEYLNPRFDIAGGQRTVGTYAGFVEVYVTGSGLNNVSQPNGRADAFYGFNASNNESTALFDNTLRLGTETQIGTLPRGFTWKSNSSLHVEAGSLHVADLAVAYEGDSFPVSGAFPLDVEDGLAPVYSPDHAYHFVMDLGSYEGTLTLGFGDGGTHDNSSDTYNISLWQVEPAPAPAPASVPEPPTFVLATLGGLVFLRWRTARQAAWGA